MSSDDEDYGYGLFDVPKSKKTIKKSVAPPEIMKFEEFLCSIKNSALQFIENFTSTSLKNLPVPAVIFLHDFELINEKEKILKYLQIIEELMSKCQGIGFYMTHTQLKYQIDERYINYKPDYFDKYSSPDVYALDNSRRVHNMINLFEIPPLSEFCNALLSNQLFVSEAETETESSESSSALLKVVATSFERFVLETKKDVFILFTATWCHISKQFLPTWNELAEKLKNTHGLSICVMDADKNYLPPAFLVPHFPYIVLVTDANARKPKAFQGRRDLDEMLQFLVDEAVLTKN